MVCVSLGQSVLVSSNSVRLPRSVYPEHELGNVEVGAVRHVVRRRVVVVMAAVTVRAEPVEMLHPQVQVLEIENHAVFRQNTPKTKGQNQEGHIFSFFLTRGGCCHCSQSLTSSTPYLSIPKYGKSHKVQAGTAYPSPYRSYAPLYNSNIDPDRNPTALLPLYRDHFSLAS